MATYGRGQMLGSGINPESFKLDYSGMANAAATQAQGVANLGASIGGAISEVGDYFKKQKEDEQKVQKSLSVAKAIGDLIPGLKPTIQGSLNILNDKEIPLSQRTAEADAIADILNLGINEVRNRQDVGFKERELGIREAQFMAENAPPMPEPVTYKRENPIPYGGGFLEGLQRGSDGQLYDENFNLIVNQAAYARGESPEVYSGGSSFTDDQGSINTPTVSMPGENTAANIDYASGLGSSPQTTRFPTNFDVPTPAPFLDAGRINAGRIDAGRIDAALDGEVLPPLPPLTPKEEIAGLERVLGIDANERQNIQSRIRFNADKEKAGKEPVTITMEKLSELMSLGVRPKGTLNPDGTFSVTDFNTGSLPQGMTIESDGQGGFKMTQGAVGAKADQQQKAADSKIDKAMALTQDLNLLEDRTKSMTPGVVGAVGRIAAEQIPGTFQAENKEVIDRVIATLTLENLQAMRNNSPTGASLGNITDKDTGLMRDSATSLRNAQSPESFRKELIRLKNLQHDVIYGSKRVLEQKLNKGEITKAQFNEAMANAPTEYLDERGAIRTKKVKGNINTLSSESQDIYSEFLNE